FSLLIVIAVYDLRHQIIPNGFVYAFIILSLFAIFLENCNLEFVWNLDFGICNLLGRILTGLIFFSFFGLVWLISRGEAMGFGDAKLALAIGWLLGPWQGFLALLFSFCIGAIIGISLVFLAKKKYNMKSKIPFGPFLVLGALIAFFINSSI
ncbi:A24 family peptidase, partial [Patescibacteria group bacterium]|nr:A24 family peptidase [Patescibacteria group bacterium]